MATEIYTIVDKPEMRGTCLKAISGGNIVGYYDNDSGSWQGFLYNLTTQTWTDLNAPGSYETIPQGIDGNDIVGYCGGSRSFLYNIATQIWAPIYSEQGSANIFPNNIDSNNVVFDIGQYGSVYTITEPPFVPLCFAPVTGDLNGDCKVDFADFATMALHWLDCNIQPATACW